jgi:tetratricopeptide (TPR) repeat protein
MTPEQWQRLEEVFQTALELAPSQQQHYLDEECANDPALRKEVESLLASLDIGRAQIEAPIQGAAHDFAAKQDAELIGRRIGPYKIISLLGHGGMGSVYKAVRIDAEFDKQVAIKIVRQGMDTGFIKERFLQERQILAQLDHPHITRLLDGGTTEEGLPYLVMEYVDGKPITDVCAERKLTIAQRLRLMLQICAAVQHAHRNLVVHRDLKPGNILVTADNTPKLLDFGIAKILASDPGSTGPMPVTMIRMMTPEYSSPEQVMGLPVTAATDVYALGAILYELLSTKKAHRLDTNSQPEIERVVVKQNPVAPSIAAGKAGQPLRWQRQIEGDLDNIVLTAMRKEPERRYNSAEQLAQDIQNHLGGLPVMARPNTIGYRAAKFITRNRLPLALATLLMVSLVAGIVSTAREAERANRRFREMRGLARTILFDVHDKLQSLPGSTEARALMITKVAASLDNLSKEAAGDLSLRRELAQAYEKIGDVEGSPFFPNLGKTDAALASYKKALEQWRFVSNASGTAEEDVQIALSRCYYRIGDVHVRLGDRDEASSNFDVGIHIVQSIAKPSDQGLILRSLAAGYHRSGDVLLELGRLSAARDEYNLARETSEKYVAAEPGPRSKYLLAASLIRNGDALNQLGDLEGAEAAYRRGIQLREEIERVQPGYGANLREQIPLRNALGNVLGNPDYPNLDRPTEALDQYKQSFAICEARWKDDPKSAQTRYDIAIAHTKLGVMLIASDPRQAAIHLEQAIRFYTELSAADPNNVVYRKNRVYALGRRARALTAAGLADAARQSLVEAQDLSGRLMQAGSDDSDSRHEVAAVLREVGRFQMAGGNDTAAVDTLLRAVATRAPAVVTGRDSLLLIDADSQDKELLAKAYEGIGSPAALKEACRAWQSSSAIWTEWGKKGIASSYSRRRSEDVSQALTRCEKKLQRAGKSN